MSGRVRTKATTITVVYEFEKGVAGNEGNVATHAVRMRSPVLIKMTLMTMFLLSQKSWSFRP
jgi:hypothetical protein